MEMNNQNVSKIRIHDTIIDQVQITDSGDIIGIKFQSEMTLTELDALFNPGASPEFYTIDDEGVDVGVYKNHKLISIRVASGVVDIVLLVSKGEISQAERMEAMIKEQAQTIEAQATRIAALEEELVETKSALDETNAMITAIEEGVANA